MCVYFKILLKHRTARSMILFMQYVWPSKHPEENDILLSVMEHTRPVERPVCLAGSLKLGYCAELCMCFAKSSRAYRHLQRESDNHMNEKMSLSKLDFGKFHFFLQDLLVLYNCPKDYMLSR